jgi:Protein of unknown function (DUF3006)
MKEGKYVVESIENGLVKLLLSEGEEIEAVVKREEFPHSIKQGDILKVKFIDGKLTSIPLESETEKRREQAKSLMEKLLNKNK